MCILTSEEVRFFRSFSSIPVVRSTLHLGFNIYGNVKKWSPYLDTTLTASEQMVLYVANTPTMVCVSKKIESPVLFVDKWACQGLQMLEDRYPSIRMTTDEVKEEANKQIAVLRDVGSKKFDELWEHMNRKRQQRFAEVLQMLEMRLNPKICVYVDIIEKTVNDYLPPIEGETIEEEDGESRQRIFARLAFIPTKVQDRLAHRYNQFVFRITWTEN